jgi:hypothetical protein
LYTHAGLTRVHVKKCPRILTSALATELVATRVGDIPRVTSSLIRDLLSPLLTPPIRSQIPC